MNDYDFLEPAQIELEEVVKYYNEQRTVSAGIHSHSDKPLYFRLKIATLEV